MPVWPSTSWPSGPWQVTPWARFPRTLPRPETDPWRTIGLGRGGPDWGTLSWIAPSDVRTCGEVEMTARTGGPRVGLLVAATIAVGVAMGSAAQAAVVGWTPTGSMAA